MDMFVASAAFMQANNLKVYEVFEIAGIEQGNFCFDSKGYLRWADGGFASHSIYGELLAEERGIKSTQEYANVEEW